MNSVFCQVWNGVDDCEKDNPPTSSPPELTETVTGFQQSISEEQLTKGIHEPELERLGSVHDSSYSNDAFPSVDRSDSYELRESPLRCAEAGAESPAVSPYVDQTPIPSPSPFRIRRRTDMDSSAAQQQTSMLSPPMVTSADHRSISVDWHEMWESGNGAGLEAGVVCCYLEMAAEKEDAASRNRTSRSIFLSPQLSTKWSSSLSPADSDAGGNHGSLAGSRDSAEAEWVAVYCGKDRSFKVNNLKPGRKYSFRIRVLSSSSNQACSISVPAVFSTLPSVPDPPGLPVLANRTRTFLKVRWAPPADSGGMQVTEYVLEMSPAPGQSETDQDASGGHTARDFLVIYSGPELSAKVIRLLPGVEYSFRVKAINCIGPGDFSPISSFRTSPSVPLAPAPPLVKSIMANSVLLEWQEPASCGSPVTGYTLEFSQGGSNGFIAVYSGSNSSCAVQGLRSGSWYQFRVLAHNEVGRSLPSPPTDIQTAVMAPHPPEAPSVAGVQSFGAFLEWTEPSDNGGSTVIGFVLETCTGATAGRKAWNVSYDGPGYGCTLAGLLPGTQYCIRLRARNVEGLSLPSGEAMFTTLPAVPQPPGAPSSLESSRQSVTISWEPPGCDGGAPVTAYRLEVQALEMGPTESPSRGHGFTCAYMGPKIRTEVSGLRSGCSYGFRVCALNRLGSSLWSPVSVFQTEAGPPGAPDPPVLAFSCSAASIPLRWTPPDCNGSPVSGYRLQVCPLGYGSKKLQSSSESGGSMSAEGAARLSSTAMSACEVNAGGHGPAVESSPSSHTSSLSKTLLLTGDPIADLAASWSGGRSIALSTEERSLEGGDSLQDHSEDGRLGGTFRDVYQGPAVSFTVSRLQPFSSYKFRLQAFNSLGSSPFSQTMVAATSAAPPDAPLPPVPVRATDHSVTLQWEAPGRDNGSPVLTFSLQVHHLPAMAASLPSDAEVSSSSGRLPRKHKFVYSRSVGSLPAAFRESSSSGSIHSPQDPSGSHGFHQKLPQPVRKSISSVEDLPLHGDPWETAYHGSELQTEVRGLQGGQFYAFRVMARNSLGASPWSLPVQVATESDLSTMSPAVPAPRMAPEPPSVVESTDSTITLSWDAISETDSDPEVNRQARISQHSSTMVWQLLDRLEIQDGSLVARESEAGVIYRLEMSRPGRERKFLKMYEGSSTRCTVRGLMANQEYQFRLRATQPGSGHSLWSSTTRGRTQEGPTPTSLDVGLADSQIPTRSPVNPWSMMTVLPAGSILQNLKYRRWIVLFVTIFALL